MNLFEALAPLLPTQGGVVAFVGAGGKTSALYALAKHLEPRGSVLITTTTHMWNPELEVPRREGFRVCCQGELEGVWMADAPWPVPVAGAVDALFSRAVEPPGKMKGIHPSWVPALRGRWDWVLVEADGSRRLPLKAPAPHEPALPPSVDLVVGVLGLSCLGQPLGADTVHRPELLSALTGCALGESVTWRHLEALVRHPEGLFKRASGRRVILFNQWDQLGKHPAPAMLATLPADRVLCGTLLPEDLVMAC